MEIAAAFESVAGDMVTELREGGAHQDLGLHAWNQGIARRVLNSVRLPMLQEAGKPSPLPNLVRERDAAVSLSSRF